MSAIPKSQWSWELSDQMRNGDAQFLIIDYNRRTALLCWEEEHWVLPGIITSITDASSLVEEIQKALNIECCLWLSHVAWSRNEMRSLTGATGKINRKILEKCVIVLECHEEEPPVVPGYEWQSLEDKEVFHFFDSAARRIKEEIGMALNGVYSEKRTSWERPGWLQGVISLLQNIVEAQVVKPITIFRSSPTGAVFRACTAQGCFFLKSSPSSRNDAAFTEAMARIAPEYCAMPIYVDRENRTMVMRDYGKTISLWGEQDTAVRAGVFGTLALAQLSTVGKVDDLLEAGFIDARPEALIERFEEVVNHPELRFLENLCEGHEEDLSSELGAVSKWLTQFRKYTPQLKEKVKEISEKVMGLKIPATVLHNDIGTNNVCRDAETGKLKVIDWELGCIGHPFMDRWCSPSNISSYWKVYCTEAEIEECRRSLHPCSFMIDLLQSLNLMAGIEDHNKAQLLPGVKMSLSIVTRVLLRETSTANVLNS